MDTLETLYFPDTVISTDGQCSLFLFFDRVHILQPVEKGGDDDRTAGITDTFMDRGICQVHTPAPLGEDRQRFLRLVRDIGKRKDDYAAQLSALTVASLSAPKQGDAETRYGIISSLLGTPVPDPDQKETTLKAELWQARLVLSIGELLDREDREIAEALDVLQQSKTEMLDSLLGKAESDEDDELFTDLEQLQETVSIPRPGMIRQRLKAWTALHRAGGMPALPVWTTARSEAADIVLESYLEKTGVESECIWEIDLPADCDASTEEEIARIEAFRNDAKALRGKIAGYLDNLLGVNESSTSVAAEGAALREQWASLLEGAFPADRHGRVALRFFLLRSRLPGDLLASGARGLPTASESTHSILAVIG